MTEQLKENYFIRKVWNYYQKLKYCDFDTYFPFYRCLYEYYDKLNANNTDFKPFFPHLFCLGNIKWLDDSLLFTEKIVGDKYVCHNEYTGLLFLSDKIQESQNTFSKDTFKQPYLNLDYGTLKFSDEATTFIRNRYNKINNEDVKQEIKSLFEGQNLSDLVKKILRFTKADVYSTAYDTCMCEICGALAKSVTLGEYLLLDDYSERYLDLIFSPHYGSEENFRRIHFYDSLSRDEELNDDGLIGCLLGDIGAAASKLRSMCRSMGQVLKNQQPETKVNPVHVVGFSHSISFPHGGLPSISTVDLWKLVVESISLASYIDFSQQSTFKNIETLDAACEVLRALYYRYMDNTFVIKEIVVPNIVKATKLLHACITSYDKSELDKDLKNDILLHNHWIDHCIHNVRLFEGFPKENVSHKLLDRESYREYNHEDLYLYSQMGIRYFSKKKAGEHLLQISTKQICDKIDQNDFKIIKEELYHDVWTTPLLVKTIRRLIVWAEHIQDVVDVLHVCDVASALLVKLEYQYHEYENGNLIPGIIESSFQDSFHVVSCENLDITDIAKYKYENSHPLENVDDTVSTFSGESVTFMQSLFTAPVQLDFIKGFIQKYTQKLSVLKWKASDEHTLKVIEADIQKTKDNLFESVKSIQSQALQLLGVLGAFIALISVGANAISNVPIQNFGFFLIIVTISIIALLICITAVSEHDRQKRYAVLFTLFFSALIYLVANYT